MKDSLVFPLSAGSIVSNPILQYRIFRESVEWVAPMDCVIDLMLIGGHGGGAAAVSHASTVGSVMMCTGAGAGEMAIKSGIDIVAGRSYYIAAGAGGSGATAASGSYSNSPGGDGGATSFSGIGVSVSVNGGQGGRSGVRASSLAGGLGGYGGSGGDLHFPGGNGGGIVSAATAITHPTGSGSVNLLYGHVPGTNGTALREYTRGGKRDSAASTAPTGGGGAGGRGGDQLGTATTSTTTGGGGYGGNAIDLTGALTNTSSFGGPNAIGQLPSTAIQGLSSPAMFVASLIGFGIDAFGGGNGGASAAGAVAPSGGGGCGAASAAISSKAGFMGGMGGSYATSATITGHSGTGLCAPGQSVISASTSYAANGGAGDSGWVFMIIRRKM